MNEATQTDGTEFSAPTQTDAELPIEERLENMLSDSTDELEATPLESENDSEISDNEPELDAGEEIELDASQLTKILELNDNDISIGDDGKISFNTNIDGEQGQANLSDLIKSYQLEGHVNKKSMQLGEQQQQLDAYTQQVRQNLDIQLQQANALVNSAEQQLNAEYQSVPWEQLRAENAGEYSALQAEFGARNQEIQQLKQNTTVAYQQQQQQIAQQRQKSDAQFEEQERALLYKAVPEWHDEKVASQEKQEIINYMQSHNWPQEMMVGVSKYHQALLAVRDLVKRDNATPEKKIVQKKPKMVLKPGSAKTKTTAENRKAEAQRNRFRKTGSVDDLASALLDRI